MTTRPGFWSHVRLYRATTTSRLLRPTLNARSIFTKQPTPVYGLRNFLIAGIGLIGVGTYALSGACVSRRHCEVSERTHLKQHLRNGRVAFENLPRDRSIAQSTKEMVGGREAKEGEKQPKIETSVAWSTLSFIPSSFLEGFIRAIFPDWTKAASYFFKKLKKELSMDPGTLSYEIWQESLSPYVNPEITWQAQVRLSPNLCDEEQIYLSQRRKFMKKAMANYLEIAEEEIHEEDIPVIAMTASGGGVRAMVASAGYFGAAKSAGLYDCTTYTAGVSGSCWTQALYLSSISNTSFPRLVNHLKSRLEVHPIAPPKILSLLDSAPTNRYLLRGVVERAAQGYTSFGLVDVYGILLAARILVPANELEVKDEDLKLSNQKRYLEHGEHPMPIYTCVRHEILGLKDGEKGNEVEKLKVAAVQDWFQWFEVGNGPSFSL